MKKRMCQEGVGQREKRVREWKRGDHLSSTVARQQEGDESVQARGGRNGRGRVSVNSRSLSVRGFVRRERDSSTTAIHIGLPYLPPLLTKNPYYVGNSSYEGNREEGLIEAPRLKGRVEIPCWREVESNYKDKLPLSDVDENTDDATYLKKHDKLEKLEKQRKMWDLRRIREQIKLQRLRARAEMQNAAPVTKKSKYYITSLLPSLSNATHIQVDENIPVSCFGKSLPVLHETDFVLPFLLN